MSPPTATRRSVDGATPVYDRVRLWHVVVAACAIGLVVVISQVVQSPGSIGLIEFENPTRYDVSVMVTSGDRSGWIDVGTVPRKSSERFEEISDHGDVWIFRFSAQGRVGGDLRLSRSELERAQWSVSIPERVEDELLAEGAPLPPD